MPPLSNSQINRIASQCTSASYYVVFGVRLTLLFHRLRDLEADQPRNQNSHIQLAEYRLHHREAAGALGDRQDISETSRRQTHEAVVDEGVKRSEQRRNVARRPLEE